MAKSIKRIFWKPAGSVTFQVKHMEGSDQIGLPSPLLSGAILEVPANITIRKGERKLSLFVGYRNVNLENSRESTDKYQN